MKRIFFVVLSVLVVSSFLLSACGTPATEVPSEPVAPEATEAPAPTEVPAPTFSGTATITFVQEPDNLNPYYTSMSFSGYLRPFYLKPPWDFDENAQPVPVLVTEIPSVDNGGVSADGKTITLMLRDDVTWSDGEPLTAEDFAFTYDMIMSDQNTPLGRYPYDPYVVSVVAQDPTTVVVTLSDPFAAWLTSIFYLGVLPKHVLQPVFDAEGTIDNAEWNRNPVPGLGPFVLDQWESGSHLSFMANPNWYQPPKLEQVFVRIVPDDAAQEAAILAGDSDIGTFLSSDQIEKLEAGGTVKVVPVSSGYNEAWFLNVNPDTARPFMLDVNVRKAIAMSADRFTIVKDLLVAEINPVNTTFWDMTPPYDSDLEPYPYDPEQAKALLDAAGWVDSNGDGTRDKEGVELVVRYATNQRELRKNIQAVVEQQWKEVGIGTELANYSSDIFWNRFNDGGPMALGDYDVAEYSSVMNAYPDPDTDVFTCAQVVNADNPDGTNDQGYCNPALDELFKQQAVTSDPAARKELFNQIQQIMYDEVVYVGMWKDPDLWSVSSRLKNVRFSGVYPFWNAYEWEIVE